MLHYNGKQSAMCVANKIGLFIYFCLFLSLFVFHLGQVIGVGGEGGGGITNNTIFNKF